MKKILILILCFFLMAVSLCACSDVYIDDGGDDDTPIVTPGGGGDEEDEDDKPVVMPPIKDGGSFGW